MIDFLTHYYRPDAEPFRSLSALSDEEAIKIMQLLCDDTPFGARFKDPVQYMDNRRQTEQWVREMFKAKGGVPTATYPMPMVLGTSKWMAKQSPDSTSGEIRIPLSAFSETDVSFTYPDSMLSRWFGSEKPIEFYMPEFHGKVFTLLEILAIVAENGLPEDGWETNLPGDLAPYIEAQVWNHAPLATYESGLISV